MGGCVNNLRQIDGAKHQILLEHGTNVAFTWDLLRSYVGGPARSMPKCPNGGVYSIGGFDECPTCSLGASGVSNADGRHLLSSSDCF